MINPHKEKLLNLRAVGEMPMFHKNGRPERPSAVRQWMRLGVVKPGTANHPAKLIRLESILLPGGIHTSREAVYRFLAALNGVDVSDISAEGELVAANA